MTANPGRVAGGALAGISCLVFSSAAYAQSTLLANPDPVAAEEAAETSMPQIIPGFDNQDLAFVAVMLVLIVGLIWIWVRGQTMAAEADMNASILKRAESKRSVVMNDAELAAAEAADKAASNGDVQDMVSQRMGLRAKE